MHFFVSATLKQKNKTKPEYEFVSTTPSCFKKKKKKEKVLQSKIKKSTGMQREHLGKASWVHFLIIYWLQHLALAGTSSRHFHQLPQWLGSSVFNHLATGIIKLEEPSAALHTDTASFISAEGCGACRVPRPQWKLFKMPHVALAPPTPPPTTCFLINFNHVISWH